jgi:hypothetical protein
MRIWECGMRIVDFNLKFLFRDLFFKSEILNPQSAIDLTPLLHRIQIFVRYRFAHGKYVVSRNLQS